MKIWAYVACAISLLGFAAFFICGLLVWTPLGSKYGQHWRYNGGMGVGRFSPFPNQSALSYSSSNSGKSHIYTVSWTGNAIRQLTNDAREDSDVCVSPTGKFIVFARQDGDAVHLWRMNPSGAGQKQLTFGKGSQTEPSISAGGGKIAYVESLPASGTYGIGVMLANGTRQTSLTGGTLAVQDTTPVFDPTGTKIYFSRYQFSGANQLNASGRMEVWAINITGKAEQRIGFGNHPAISPDGQQLAFFDAPQNQTLGLMNTTGTGRTIIRQNMGYGACLKYAPDGRHLLVWASVNSKAEIASIDLTGKNLQKIAMIK